jgi:hypothetical protein
VGVTTLPNNPRRATARKLVRTASETQAARKAVSGGTRMLVGTPFGRRLLRRKSQRAAHRTLQGVHWAPLAYVPAAVTLVRLRRRLGPPPAIVTIAAAYATPAIVAYALPRGRARDYLTWLSHMWAYKVAFEVPYDTPEQARRRLRVDQPIAIDRFIGRGVPPGQRLQRALRRPPQLTLLDKLLTGIYLVWEAEPHLALGWLRSRYPGHFPGAVLRMALTFDCTLLGYFATPTAPPWWASEIEGRMDGQVRRVTAEVMRAAQGKPRPGTPQDHITGSNPWAAWPSDHFASALSAAIALAEADRRAGVLGFAYAGALGVALVYTGEHYVIDLLLGTFLALGIHGAGTMLSDSWVRLVEAAIQPGPRFKRQSRLFR